MNPRDVIYTKTRPRMPSADQSSRRPSLVRNARLEPTASSAAIQAHPAPSLRATASSQAIRRRLSEGHL
ncbi:hypothetical protein TNCV_4967391 [Trichonephila clavipes]|nr:hypothetical protein TNCV_4967391 [Trichonephila clavipes]